MSRVVMARCTEDDRVAEALDVALEPFGGLGGARGFGRKIERGSRVLVKPNFLRAYPASAGVSPSAGLLDAVCRRLLDLGAEVRIGDSPAFGSARSVAEATGIADIARALEIPIVEFDKPVRVRSAAPDLTLQIDREVIESDAVVNLCKLKAHQQLGMTVGVKNLFGCITGKRKPVWHLRLGDRANDFGEMLIAVYRAVAPVLSICDAVYGMDGNGPAKGRHRPVGVLLAAEDAVAMDVVAAHLVGHPPETLRVLAAAETLGEGAWRLDRIELLGDVTLDDARVHDWQPPEGAPIFFNPLRIVASTAKQIAILAGERGGA